MNKKRNNGYINVGLDKILPAGQIIGMFDLDSVTVQKNSRNFVAKAQKNGEIEDMTTDLPVTFVLCDGVQSRQKVLLTSFSLPTLYTHITRQFP